MDSAEKLNFPLSGISRKTHVPPLGKRPVQKTTPKQKSEVATVQSSEAKQKNYKYSSEALEVLAKAKHNGYKMNDFVSNAVIEYGKIHLDDRNDFNIKRRIARLERVVASMELQSLRQDIKNKGIDLEEIESIISSLTDDYDPHGDAFSTQCRELSKNDNIFKGDSGRALLWALMYAKSKKMNLDFK